MAIESSTLADPRVYTQDTAPTDTRDGTVWVDTSVAGIPEMKVYDSASATWESAFSDETIQDVYVQTTQPSVAGVLWVDTSSTPYVLKVTEETTTA